MTLEELLELYPTPFLAAMFVGVIQVFLLIALSELLHLPAVLIYRRKEASVCYGFHTGMIDGFCHCHSCPHRNECMHYQDDRRLTKLRIKLYLLRTEKKKP